jgi:hypothetical protein
MANNRGLSNIDKYRAVARGYANIIAKKPKNIAQVFLKGFNPALEPYIRNGSIPKQYKKDQQVIQMELAMHLGAPIMTYVHRKIKESRTKKELYDFMHAVFEDQYWDTWMNKNSKAGIQGVNMKSVGVTRQTLARAAPAIKNAYTARSNPYHPLGRERIMRMGRELAAEVPAIRARTNKRA